jgi:hypothetical protein
MLAVLLYLFPKLHLRPLFCLYKNGGQSLGAASRRFRIMSHFIYIYTILV